MMHGRFRPASLALACILGGCAGDTSDGAGATDGDGTANHVDTADSVGAVSLIDTLNRIGTADEGDAGAERDAGESLHRIVDVGPGWARTSVNAPIFRKDALSSDDTHQYVAYYDDDGQVIVARRRLDERTWQVEATGFSGRPRDAHDSISLIVDGAGYLHLAWDHHVDPLRYARSVAPGTLAFDAETPMLGVYELEVTYPEFHVLPSGDLLFAYRDGRSGNGRLVLNRHDIDSGTWSRVQARLLDGEGRRNAYWQLHVDAVGTVHLSWIWRETSDVATNHDIHYARSSNGGVDWSDVDGEALSVPITLDNTPPVWEVAPGRNLINQTALTVDHHGSPAIATYFRPAAGAVTDIQLVFHDPASGRWTAEPVSRRSSDFDLAGAGTKSLPLSRPQVLAERRGDERWLHVLYRDAEKGDRAVLASSNRTAGTSWTHAVLPGGSLDRWEPNVDSRLWRSQGRLHVYLQRVGQVDREGVDEDYPPTGVRVLEVALP